MTKKRKFEQERFEFMFRINGNPICQRYFDIRGFKKESLNSIELKEMMDKITGLQVGKFGVLGIIPKFLKTQSVDNVWKYFNPYKPQTQEDIDENKRNIFEKEDTFSFEFKVDGEIVAVSEFTGNYFQPRVRYQVNIKDIIPDIMYEIRDTLSKNSYTTDFNGSDLKFESINDYKVNY